MLYACSIALIATAADIRCDPGLSCGAHAPPEDGPVCEGRGCDFEDLALGRSHTCGRRANEDVVCWGSNSNQQLGVESLRWSDASLVPERAVRRLHDAVLITTGEYHSCAAREDRSVVCWGGVGRHVFEEEESPYDPYRIGVGDVIGLAAGARHTCAVSTDGRVACWGDNTDRQLGTNAVTSGPIIVGGLPTAIGVTTGSYHSCAWTERDEVWCWGDYREGSMSPPVAPVFVTRRVGLLAMVAGYRHTCLLQASGHVQCWGRGDDGELGRGTFSSDDLPDLVLHLEDVTQITAGGAYLEYPDDCVSRPEADECSNYGAGAHTCALRHDGRVLCWGANAVGQLGNGATDPSATPTLVVDLDDVLQVRAGGRHTCAIRANGEVVCWGSNEFGQLGTGAPTGYRVAPAALNSFK